MFCGFRFVFYILQRKFRMSATCCLLGNILLSRIRELENSSFACMLARTLFASTPRRTSCNAKPQRGVTKVASRFNGWYIAARKKRAFRYATSNPCRVPTARYPLASSLPAIEMAGRSTLVASYLKNPCQMPTASLEELEQEYFCLAKINSIILKFLTIKITTCESRRL